MTITALRGFVANECAQSDARAEALRVHANATVIEARLVSGRCCPAGGGVGPVLSGLGHISMWPP